MKFGYPIIPFSIIALPNVNIVVPIYLSVKSQTFKVHREHGISDTTGDKICGSLTDAITVMHAPATYEFAIKFKPSVLHSCLSEDIPVLVDNHLMLSKYLKQEIVDELKSKHSFFERVEFAETWLCRLYIEGEYRGHRYSELLLAKARADCLNAGFKPLYLSTEHIELYEKYGFSYIGQGYHPWGESSRIYQLPLENVSPQMNDAK